VGQVGAAAEVVKAVKVAETAVKQGAKLIHQP